MQTARGVGGTTLLAAVAMSFLFFFELTKWVLVDAFTPFLVLPIAVAAYALLVLSFLASVWRLSRPGRTAEARQLPLCVNVLTVVLWLTVPFTEIYLGANFQGKAARRDHVVTLIQQGALVPNVAHSSALIQLPPEDRELSAGGGQVVILREAPDVDVLFYTYRGVLDSFAGFMYRSDPSRPIRAVANTPVRRVVSYDTHWVWISS